MPLSQRPNSPLELMSLTHNEIETRLDHLSTTRDSLVNTYERLLLDKEQLSEEIDEVCVQLEEADMLELEELKRSIPTRFPD